MRGIITACVIGLASSSCTLPIVEQSQAQRVIFETDMGNDIDDALALDMLYKYQNMGMVDILGISVNKDNQYAAQFIDIMNTWYGYPDIPIAVVRDGIDDPTPTNFCELVYKYRDLQGEAFQGSVSDYEKLSESVTFYRKVLSAQPDSSVVIISVGFLTNLSRLMDSVADSISSMTGKELIEKKVKYLSLMGGNFNGMNPYEYNIINDLGASQNLFARWPTEIVVSPYEVGASVLFPGEVISKDLAYTESHPLRIAYESYQKMPYNRPTWDLTAVLCVAEGNKEYFSESAYGIISIDSLGGSTFTASDEGFHRYLIADSSQRLKMQARFANLIRQRPHKNR